MSGADTSRWIVVAGLSCVLNAGFARAHQVIGVRTVPGLPVVGETVTLTVEGLLDNDCPQNTSADAQVSDHRITIEVQVIDLPRDGPCLDVPTSFEQPVHVPRLGFGNYVIDVDLTSAKAGTESFRDVAGLVVHERRVVYKLKPGSWFMNDCPICDRIPIELPMTGTFDLLRIGPGNIFDFYDVGGVKFHAEGYDVVAQGRYQKSDPWIAGLQYMNLDTAVNNEPGLVLDSDFILFNGTGELPVIDIKLAEMNDSLVRVYRTRIVAAPLRHTSTSIMTATATTLSSSKSAPPARPSPLRTIARPGTWMTTTMSIRPTSPCSSDASAAKTCRLI